MQWPLLQGKTRLSGTLDVFGGYNHNLRIGEGEFFDMKNMSSDAYPILAPRKRREVHCPEGSHGLIARDGLCRVEGRNFMISDYAVDMGLTEGPKDLVSMGAYVIILPDKKYINTADLDDRGSIEATFTTVNPVVFSLCRADGTELDADYAQPQEPSSPGNQALWVDQSESPWALKQWSDSAGMWVGISGTCVKIASPGIGKGFSQYDGVFVTGLTGNLTDGLTGELLALGGELAALEGCHVVEALGDDYLVVTGILSGRRTITDPVTVSREMPAMDFVIERENRLWGCRYGLNNCGQVVNEIYASKLGDFKNWNCFMGISTDSYTLSLGSDGPFTGAAVYGGCPLFWKENCVHKIFGDYPANFGIQTTPCRGVERGSGKSLAIVGELLYYKARHAVCVYDGAMPAEISAPLGNIHYEQAVAGGHGNKYYISMVDPGGNRHLFVYDTAKDLWHREDDLWADDFCSCEGALYCLEHGTGRILSLLGKDAKNVPWMVETGPMGLSMTERKYLSRLVLRLSMEDGSRIRVSIQYDSVGGWETAGVITGGSLGSFSFSVRPRRCDHFRLRLEGTGEARLYSITKILRQGSERI